MIFKFDFEFQILTSGIKYIRDMIVDCAPTNRPPGDQRGVRRGEDRDHEAHPELLHDPTGGRRAGPRGPRERGDHGWEPGHGRPRLRAPFGRT